MIKHDARCDVQQENCLKPLGVGVQAVAVIAQHSDESGDSVRQSEGIDLVHI